MSRKKSKKSKKRRKRQNTKAQKVAKATRTPSHPVPTPRLAQPNPLMKRRRSTQPPQSPQSQPPAQPSYGIVFVESFPWLREPDLSGDDLFNYDPVCVIGARDDQRYTAVLVLRRDSYYHHAALERLPIMLATKGVEGVPHREVKIMPGDGWAMTLARRSHPHKLTDAHEIPIAWPLAYTPRSVPEAFRLTEIDLKVIYSALTTDDDTTRVEVDR